MICSDFRIRSTTAIAALTIAVAVPASAQNLYYDPDPAEVTINVTVEKIAVLSVLKGSGTMLVDSPSVPSGNFMLPPSTGNWATNLNDPDADIPVVRLETNFDVTALRLDFPRRNGFNRGCGSSNPGATYFGEAVRDGGSAAVPEDVIGVWPRIIPVINAAGDLDIPGVGHNCNDNPINFNDPAGPAGNGLFDFAVGISTQWGNTLQASSNPFAQPGIYEISMDLTIIP